MAHRAHSYRGFTFVETLAVIGIVAFITVAMFAFFRDTFEFNSAIQSSLKSQNEARRILRPFANEVRGATRSALGGYPIELASTTAFTFYVDLDEDSVAERVRYFLEGTTFKKGVTNATGSPLRYATTSEKIVAIVNNVVATSTPIFRYYTTTYTGASTTQPLAQPVSPVDVRLISVSITVDEDPQRPPAPFVLTTQISFRNLKDNL